MSDLKKLLFSTKGRISASQYTVSVVVLTILSALLAFLLIVIISVLPNIIKVIVVAAFFVLLIWIGIALVVKRLHDRGHSGGWILLYLLPVVNVILFFYLILGKGKPRTNRFGRRPAPAPEPLSSICYCLIFLGMFSPFLKVVPATAKKMVSLFPPPKLQPVKEQTGSRNFYSVAYSDILLSRTEFSTHNNPQIKYILQTVTGKDKNGFHPPQLHIKRVVDDGMIEQDCLSYLFDIPHFKMPNDPRMSSFEYHPSNNSSINRVYGYSHIYVRTADPSWNILERMFGMGYIGVGVSYTQGKGEFATKKSEIYLNASLIGPMGWAKMVPAEEVKAKEAEWEIQEDIVRAFGKGSNCSPLGHNRKCAGCLFQK